MRRSASSLGLLLVLCVGCPQQATPTPAPITGPTGADTGTATKVETTAARPGYLSGTVRDERGNQITVPGAKYLLGIEGIAEASAQNVSYSPSVKPDGTYEAKLVAGTYHPVRAMIEVVFNESTYRFDLDPVQDNTGDREAANGIVQDFVWKLSGPHFRYAQSPDPSNSTNWYGGSVRVSLSGWRNDLSKGVDKPVDGTKYVFTLEPTGNLIDGSEAKPMTFERTYTAAARGFDPSILNSIPIGAYTLTGVEVAPDGARHVLVFETAYAKFEPMAVVEFPMSEITYGPALPAFDFDRQVR